LRLRGAVAQDKNEIEAKAREQEKIRQEAMSSSGELHNRLAEKDEQMARLQELVDRLDTQKTELETQLAISRAEMKEAVQKGWSLSDAERGLREQLRAQQDRNENLRDKLRQREEDVEEMTRERLHALASSVEARETLDSVTSEINLVFARLVTLREKLRSCDPRELTKLAEQFRDRVGLAERMKILREVVELPSE
jgi:DNA repair exonuclease SbcCD ATPase subunit